MGCLLTAFSSWGYQDRGVCDQDRTISGKLPLKPRTYLKLVLKSSGGCVRVHLVQTGESGPQLLGLNGGLPARDQLLQGVVDEDVLCLDMGGGGFKQYP